MIVNFCAKVYGTVLEECGLVGDGPDFLFLSGCVGVDGGVEWEKVRVGFY